MNTFKTSILLAGLTALVLAAGLLLGGEGGLVLAIGFALFGNIFAYWCSDKMVLSMYGARQVDETSHPALVGTVKQLAARAQLPMPKVYVIDTPQPNAFATGRNPDNAAVAATTGLLDNMSHQEIAGVMAHELAHVKNRRYIDHDDYCNLSRRSVDVGGLCHVFWRSEAKIAPSDRSALFSHDPCTCGRHVGANGNFADPRVPGRPPWGRNLRPTLWLASALEKLETLSHRIDNDQAEHNPATAHLFIINPLHARKVDNLFSTHPSTSNRVNYLRDMAAASPKWPLLPPMGMMSKAKHRCCHPSGWLIWDDDASCFSRRCS